MTDFSTWNTCGARLAQVMKHIKKGVMVVALQEVRPPRGTAWASMHGYVVFFEERGKRRAAAPSW